MACFVFKNDSEGQKEPPLFSDVQAGNNFMYFVAHESIHRNIKLSHLNLLGLNVRGFVF